MGKFILGGIAAILVVLIAVIATQPDEFSVTRSATMNAAPAEIFAHVNDLHKWDAWSPWAKLDPDAAITFEGTEAGVGSVMRWDGNHNIGKGSMTITGNAPDKSVAMTLDFIKPMESTSTVDFTFTPDGDKTTVTWTMQGKNNFIGKAFGLIFDCEKMIGDMYDEGLANLKAIVEA